LLRIAEGVETAEQLHFQQSEGIDRFQGYYFSRPVDVEAVAARLVVEEPEAFGALR
jgi:EAL domain-containing protein (putative c-di-GMP-specific phosphodiesterase class I)